MIRLSLTGFYYALFVYLGYFTTCNLAKSGLDDLITAQIPGLNFNPNFKQYSGYLNATDGKNLFYWLVESQNDPSKDPIILWLQGGPGCSALGAGMLSELGPFHVGSDGHSLWENVFTWNKFANVLFMESPSGVGFSYSDSGDETTDDDLTAYYNFQALRDFFYSKFPNYQQHDFYITGESYAGVYIPTLSKVIIDGIARKHFPHIFRGIAIGNGILSERQQLNSLVHLLYYHGIIGVHEWDSLLSVCCSGVVPDKCDFYEQISSSERCHAQIDKIYRAAYEGGSVNDPYNMYQDCYSDTPNRRHTSTLLRTLPKVQSRFKLAPMQFVQSIAPGATDMAHQLNYDSTDSNFGFQCWANDLAYFNNPEVKKALHVADKLLNKTWCSCCDIPYKTIYDDMGDTFSYILKKSAIRVLIYNGDVDLVCNFLGDQWFVEQQVAPQNKLKVVKQRMAWQYRNQVAGFVKRFQRLDLLTVKGSGHFVPEDRAGPALQMIVNFIQNTGDYSKPTGIDVTPHPASTPSLTSASAKNGPVINWAFISVALTVLARLLS